MTNSTYSRSSYSQTSYSHGSKEDKAFNEQAFSDIVAAISEGKYSWACVLILRFAGYNPLHYIPYRTYNRILKANMNFRSKPMRNEIRGEIRGTQAANQMASHGSVHSDIQPINQPLSQSVNPPMSACHISDLSHLDVPSEEEKQTVQGGQGLRWWFPF